MTTITASAAMRLILLKAVQNEGKFKHSGKYYLAGGRWHKLHQDQAAPKGAPVAAHPHAAGQHEPAKHFTDAEWEQLKLPPENVNAGSYNKHLDKLKELSEAGHVTGILGMGFGTNTYGKKAAVVANTLLKLHGSEHQVTPGQKAGEHHAVQSSPIPSQAEADAELAQMVAGTKLPEQKPTEAGHVEGDKYVMPLDAAIEEHKDLVQAAETPSKEDDKAELADQKAELGKMEEAKQAQAEPATSGLSMPAFEEGKTVTGVVAYYEKVAQKILDMAAAGDAAGLAQMKADGLQPNSKGKISNTWKGKTANSKLLLALHAQALEQAGGTAEPAPAPVAEPVKAKAKVVVTKPKAEPVPAPATSANDAKSKLDQIPWDGLLLPDSNKNAKSHNGKVAQIKAMAYAGDIAGLEAFKAGVNTYGQKQNKLAQTALAALKESGQAQPEAPTLASEQKPAPEPAPKTPGEQMVDDLKAAGFDSYVSQKHGVVLSKPVASGTSFPKTYANLTQAENAAGKLAAAGFDAHVAGVKAPYLVKITGKSAPQTPAAQPAEAQAAGPQKPTFSHPAWDGTVASLDKWAANGEWDKLSDYAAGVHGGGQGNTPDGNKAKQYALELLQHHGQGPQDGDTKQGADGMLVFKAGRWHKQKQQAAAQQPAPASPAAPPAPAIKALKPGEAIKVMASVPAKTASGKKAELKALAVAGDLAGLQKFIADHPNLHASKMVAQALIDAMTGGAGAPAQAAPAQPAAKPASGGVYGQPEAVDSWTQTGPQGGSNPGGKFKDHNGVEWYVKFPSDEGVAKSEVLAAKLYAAAGIAGQDAKLITKGGKLGIASRWVDVKKAAAADLAKADGTAAGFAVDAWLANWDVVGLSLDNLQLGADGKAIRVDAGGSLQYRAQGGKKAFGHTVTELDSLRDAAINPQSAAVFGKLTNADITASVAKVLAVPDATITMLVNQFGPGDAANKQALIDALIARKADLAAKFPKAVKQKKKPVFDASKISAPPDFMNWGGSGKSGPSSKEFLNVANHRAAQYIYKAAQTGNIDAVKAIQAPTYDKASGAEIGKASVLDHPSQHIKGYAQQVINEINYQLNPPKKFRFNGGHPLHSLNSSYPPFTGALKNVVSKVGKFIALGDPGILAIEDLGLPKITFKSGQLSQSTYASAAQAAIAKMPQTQRQAVQAYTGSSYHSMNGSLWAGNPSGEAKAAAEALHTLGHDIAPGTVLSRKISIGGADLDQILNATGKVLQEPAIMSTSIRPSSWSGNVHLKLHVGPGVKGLWVGHGSKPGGGSLSLHGGEDEMVLPPNTRLLILSVKKSNGSGDADGFGAGTQHVVEAVILPSEGY